MARGAPPGYRYYRPKRRTVKKLQRFYRKYVDDMTPAKNIDGQFLSSTDLTDFTTGAIVGNRIKAGLNTENREIALICTKKEWAEFMENNEYIGQFQLTHFGNASGLLVTGDEDTECEQYFTFRLSNSGCTVNAYGSEEFVEDVVSVMLDNFEESDANIEWIYSADGSSVSVALRKDRNPISEMYSFLKDENLEDYYDRFMRSSASILLLIGKPGTGKTSFIRGLLQHTKSNATVTYDPSVLAKDYVFAQFIEGDSSVFIIEDADLLLGKRTDGNDMMHKFLNVGDGLVTTAGKKMIFSTNLPSIRDVDPALIRPGRCFDVLNFEELKLEKAQALVNKLGIPMPEEVKKSYSLAELFHTQVQAPSVKKVGGSMGFI